MMFRRHLYSQLLMPSPDTHFPPDEDNLISPVSWTRRIALMRPQLPPQIYTPGVLLWRRRRTPQLSTELRWGVVVISRPGPAVIAHVTQFRRGMHLPEPQILLPLLMHLRRPYLAVSLHLGRPVLVLLPVAVAHLHLILMLCRRGGVAPRGDLNGVAHVAHITWRGCSVARVCWCLLGLGWALWRSADVFSGRWRRHKYPAYRSRVRMLVVRLAHHTWIVARVAKVAWISAHASLHHSRIGWRALLGFKNAVALITRRSIVAETTHGVTVIPHISGLPWISRVSGVSTKM